MGCGLQVNHGPFSDEVVQSLQTFLDQSGSTTDAAPDERSNWDIPQEEVQRRRDFRKHRIFTIDPTTAKDLDDALHICDLGDGTVELGVHIADVSFFVHPDTAVDQEAQHRATSVYIVHKVIPMLPRILCEQLCSLNPSVDRLAFSVVWRMHKDGTIVEEHPPWFGRTVIRSCCKLDYATAQKIIDGTIPRRGPPEDPDRTQIPAEHWDPLRRPTHGHKVDEVLDDVLLFHSVAHQRRQRRFAVQGGALALNQPKLCFRLDQDGNPQSVFTYPIKHSNQLVEEYMLLANYLVAQHLILHAGDTALLRHHPPPVPRTLQLVATTAQQLWQTLAGPEVAEDEEPFDATTSGALHQSLQRLSARLEQSQAGGGATVTMALTAMLTNPMKPAMYMAVGSMEEQSIWRHYALNIPYYTHFTSPIRRYADVIVHRLLAATMEAHNESGPLPASCALFDPEASVDPRPSSAVAQREASFEWSVSKVQTCADRCNEMRMQAKVAQEDSDKVYLCVYLRSHPLVEQAVVTGVGEKFFSVIVTSLGVDARVYLDDLQEKRGITAQWDSTAGTITLTSANPDLDGWPNMRVAVFGLVMVQCGCRQKPPMAVQIDLLGPIAESPLLSPLV